MCCSICIASILPFLMIITPWSIAFPFLFPFPFLFKLSVPYTYYCKLSSTILSQWFMFYFWALELRSSLVLSLYTRFCSQFAPAEEARLLVNWFYNHERVCMFLCSNQRWFQKSLEQVWRGLWHGAEWTFLPSFRTSEPLFTNFIPPVSLCSREAIWS